MSKFEIVEVPFTQIGNRRAITDHTLAENPWLTDFLSVFEGSIERDDARCCWFFYPA